MILCRKCAGMLGYAIWVFDYVMNPYNRICENCNQLKHCVSFQKESKVDYYY